MDEKYLITIKGTMEQGGHQETVELMTHGGFVKRDGNFFIMYRETEATGYEGCTTTVKIAEDGRRVAMMRYGKAPSQLIIEKGTRHLCHYETGYGGHLAGGGRRCDRAGADRCRRPGTVQLHAGFRQRGFHQPESGGHHP